MKRRYLIGTLVLLVVVGGVLGWSQMHARHYS